MSPKSWARYTLEFKLDAHKYAHASTLFRHVGGVNIQSAHKIEAI